MEARDKALAVLREEYEKLKARYRKKMAAGGGGNQTTLRSSTSSMPDNTNDKENVNLSNKKVDTTTRHEQVTTLRLSRLCRVISDDGVYFSLGFYWQSRRRVATGQQRNRPAEGRTPSLQRDLHAERRQQGRGSHGGCLQRPADRSRGTPQQSRLHDEEEAGRTGRLPSGECRCTIRQLVVLPLFKS